MNTILSALAIILVFRVLYVAVKAFIITFARRRATAFAASNENLVRAEDFTIAAPAAANAGKGPISGDPLVYGGLAGVAETSYTPPTGVTTGNISLKLIGAFLLSVTAKSGLSPSVNAAIAVGDKLYADGGTTDATTNCTYGFTIDKNSGGVYFGNALDAVTSGSTATIRVRLKVAG